MADKPEEAEADAADAAKGGGKSKKKLIVIGAAALLLLGGGGAFFLMSGGEPEPAMAEGGAPAESAEMAAAAAVSAAEAALDNVFFSLPSVLVNLSTDSSRNTYLRVAATLEITNAVDAADAKEKASAIMDGFQTFLREMRPSDIAGSGGLLRLKEELLVRANAAIGRDVVQNVLLTEFLVQ